MEQKSSETCKQESGRNIHSCEQWNQYGRAEHRERMLETKNDHLGIPKGTGIIDGIAVEVVVTHRLTPFLKQNRNGSNI